VIARQEGGIERALGSTLRASWSDPEGFDELLVQVANRAVTRLEAAPVKPGRYPVVLDPAAAGTLFHRAVAHLARPALPGADPDVLPLGSRIGPELLTLGDDSMAPAFSAFGPYDDEGTETHRTILVQNGVVLSHLQSRETSGASGQSPTGHARAGSLQGVPYPRATGTFVAPGQGNLDDLIEGIGVGIYLCDAMACEHSEAGLLFRPGAARMIRGGHLAEPVKGVRIGGDLLELLGRIDGVGGDFRWATGAGRCRDGTAGLVPETSGAPHVRLGGVAIQGELT
jgi:TldD protein